MFGLGVSIKQADMYGTMESRVTVPSSGSIGNMSGSVYENKYAGTLKNDRNLSKCCKEKEYFICERSKGELLL